jgi:hypothetical protein
MGTSGLPEMLDALAIDVGAAQSDIPQHAVVEFPEQAATPRPLPPIEESSQQACRELTDNDTIQTMRRSKRA